MPERSRRSPERYPLSPLQQGMLFHWLRAPASGVDIEQITCTIDAVDVRIFLRAWEQLAGRHATLRTIFLWQDGDLPEQEVLEQVPLLVHEQDLRGFPAAEQRSRVSAYLAEDRTRGFDLGSPPLFRLALFRTGEQQYEFVWTFPHILLDGRSFVLLLRELLETLRALEEGRAPAPAESRPYRDFITWREQLDPGPAVRFWKESLAGYSEPVVLDAGPPAPFPSGAEHAEQEIRLSRSDTLALREFAQRHELTVNTMVQGAWALMLGRYSGSDDVVFGATRAGRRTAMDGEPAVDSMVGLFINTLPVRVRIPPDQPAVAWLKQIRADQIGVRAFEHTSLMHVQAASDLAAGTPLFETLLVYENQQQTTSFNALDPRFRNFQLLEKSNFSITLHGYGEEELLLRAEYSRHSYDDGAVTRMLGHLAVLLREFVEHGDRPVGTLKLLTPGERRQLEAWNQRPDGRGDFPRDRTVHQLFAEQAAKTPDAVAIALDSATLSYAELDRRANLLAHRLRTLGVEAGSTVGLYTERSFEMVIATLAILKAGGVYVPLDPAYPAERLALMLADAACRVVLTQRHLEAALREVISAAGPGLSSCRVQLAEEVIAGSGDDPGIAGLSTESPAYIIYTSGSTGRPKGVVVPHRAIVRLVRNTNYVDLGSGEKILGFAPISFDAATFEIWGALLNGGRLVLAPPGIELTALGELVEQQGITTLWLTAALFHQLVETDLSRLSGVRQLLAGGDVLSVPHVRTALAQLPGCRLINGYGPTENTTFTCCYRIPADWPADQAIPIGHPIASTQAHVLDARLQPVPMGVPGELYAGGDGVGLGYLNRPELTAERFVPDPFSGKPGARLYKTGDRVRWRSDGAIDFLGRYDDQVKIRGFRIEPGEIQARLLAHPGIRDAAVVVNNDTGEKRLVAYMVARENPLSTDALRKHLESTLPHYMVPAAFMWLPELPLSGNGKVNRKALPSPERDLSRDQVVAPRDETETRVLNIWKQILRTESIGVTDRFNDVGGNSLAAVRVFMRIQKEFGHQFQLVTMLEHDTVEQLAALLRRPGHEETWRCAVAFPTTGSGIPIFCPHAQTGNVLSYQYFAKEVGAHHPVYGLQAYGNWADQKPHESVEEMVDLYMQEVLRIQPQGPYMFMGGSLGGWLALELAQRMLARGEEVRMLAMYDTTGPGYPRYTPYGRLVKFIKGHGGVPLWRLRQIVAADKKQGRSLRKILYRIRETGRWWLQNTQRDYLYWKFERRNPPTDFPMPANLTRVRLASKRVWRHYKPRFYPGTITLFRAEIQPAGVVPDPSNGWQGMSSKLEVHTMPGGHTGGMSYPVIKDVARIFLESLAKVQEKGPPPPGVPPD